MIDKRMSYKVIITGSTGMVGKGVLLACLEEPKITKVLLINRTPLQLQHSKVTKPIHPDFTDFSSLTEKIKAFDACFHCMGVSSMGTTKWQERTNNEY